MVYLNLFSSFVSSFNKMDTIQQICFRKTIYTARQRNNLQIKRENLQKEIALANLNRKEMKKLAELLFPKLKIC